MLRSKVIGLLVCAGILLLCNGCGVQHTVQSESPLDVPPFESALPTATPRPPCLKLIEPLGNTVCGYIVSESDGRPVVGRPIFLAEALVAADNSVVFAALDQQTAPKGITDENGMFYVIDVPSNLYFLMIEDYPQPKMLYEPDTPTNDLIVDWRETEGAVDLGVISTQVFTP